MKRILSSLIKVFLSLCVTLVVLSAVIIGLARELVRDIDQFQDTIVQYVNQHSPVILETRTISGHWSGLAPKITLAGVKLYSPDQANSGVIASQVDVTFLLLRSLVSLEPRFRVLVDGLNLKATVTDEGVTIDGLDLPKKNRQSSPESMRKWVNFLMAQPRVAFINSRISIAGVYPRPVSLLAHQLQYESGVRQRYLAGRLSSQGENAFSVEVKGQVRGDPFDRDSFSSKLYARVHDANWYAWIPESRRVWQQARLESLKGNSETWIHIEKGRLKKLNSRFRLNDFSLSSVNDIQPPKIQSVEGTLLWQAGNQHDWTLGVQGLRMNTEGFIWQPGTLSLSAQKLPEDQTQYAIALDDLDIAPWVNYFLGIQSRENKVHQIISKLRPTGRVKNLAVELVTENKALVDYRFSFDLKHFQNRSWRQYPGFQDLELTAWGNKDLFLVHLDEEYLELNYPSVFRDPITLTELRGSLSVSSDDEGILLQSDVMQAATKHAESATQLSLQLFNDPEKSPFLQLQSTLRNANGKYTSTYLPASVIPDGLLSWLDDGIREGHLLRGDIVVHGPLDKSGTESLNLMLGFTVEEAVLQFLPDWKEPVRNLVADVVVSRQHVEAQVLEGRYYNQRLQHGSVRVPRYGKKIDSILHVDVLTQGAAKEGVAVLKQTPLSEALGDFVQDMDLSGELGVDLSLRVPLDPDDETEMEASAGISLDKGSFSLLPQNLTVSAVSADAYFSLEEGFNARHVQGELFGGAVSGTIRTRMLEEGRDLAILLNGDADLNQISQWRPMSVWSLLQAKEPLQYGFEMHITSDELATRIPPYFEVRTDLAGVEVSLPEPFAKSQQEQKAMRFRTILGDQATEMQVQYDRRFDLKFVQQQDQIERIALQIGEGEAVLPRQKQFTVNGHLSEFDYALWQPVLDRISAAADQIESSASNDFLFLLDDSNLKIDAFSLGDLAMGPMGLTLSRDVNRWKVGFTSQMTQGTVVLPFYVMTPNVGYSRQVQPLIFNLDRFHIDRDDTPPPLTETEDVWQALDLSPKAFPPMMILASKVTYGKSHLGSWDINVSPVENGVHIDRMNGSVDGVVFNGSGDWLEREDGSRYSRLDVDLKADNVANALSAWGVEPMLTSKRFRGKAKLGWPGAPFEFAMTRANGGFSAITKNGVFNDVNSNAANKLWGVLNLEGLLKQLQLGFDSLRESEMVYEEISASCRLGKGIVNLNALKMDTPSIKIKGKGDIDLRSRNLDVDLDVTVPVTRNLVLPAAVIGGVPAAATVFVVDKVFGSQFDKLTSLKYGVGGTIEQPNIAVKDSFSIIPKEVGESVIQKDQKEGAKKEGSKKEKPMAEAMP